MKLVWKDSAKADRKEIRTYISRHNPRAARFISKLLTKQALRLMRHPWLGYRGRFPGTREWVAHPRYILVYEVSPDADAVHILRVLHTARRWP